MIRFTKKSSRKPTTLVIGSVNKRIIEVGDYK